MNNNQLKRRVESEDHEYKRVSTAFCTRHRKLECCKGCPYGGGEGHCKMCGVLTYYCCKLSINEECANCNSEL